MTEIDTNEDRRCRGRPQVRRDDETRQVIYKAARNEFAAGGYAATSIEAVARRAGVSTKTLYRSQSTTHSNHASSLVRYA
jgi:AcrR family transcriptional regulator